MQKNGELHVTKRKDAELNELMLRDKQLWAYIAVASGFVCTEITAVQARLGAKVIFPACMVLRLPVLTPKLT